MMARRRNIAIEIARMGTDMNWFRFFLAFLIAITLAGFGIMYAEMRGNTDKINGLISQQSDLRAAIEANAVAIAANAEAIAANAAAIAEMREDIAELQADVAQLKTDVGQLQTDVAQLKADVGRLQEGMAELLSRVEPNPNSEARR